MSLGAGIAMFGLAALGALAVKLINGFGDKLGEPAAIEAWTKRVKKTEDQGQLAKYAREVELPEIRRLAVERITDNTILESMAKGTEETLRTLALRRLDYLALPVTLVRDWTSPKDGHTFSARFLRPEADSVILQRTDAKLVKLALAKLAVADKQYIEGLRRADGTLPPGRT